MKKMCDLVYHDIAYCNGLLWQMQRNRTLTLAGLKARADTFSAAMVACSKALGRNGRMAFVAVLLAATIDQLVKRYIYIRVHHVIIYYVFVSPPRINWDLDLKKGWGFMYSSLKWCWPSQQNLQPLMCMNCCPPYSFTSIIAIPPRSTTLPTLASHSSHVLFRWHGIMFFGYARTLFVNKNVQWKFHHQCSKMKEVYCKGTTGYGLIK